MLLTVGAVILFGTFLISSNKLLINSIIVADESEYSMTAVSLAQSIIDEAKTKSFDEASIGKVITHRDSLTLALLLGPDTYAEQISGTDTLGSNGFQSMQKFDDIDDYKNYTRRVDTPEAEGFILETTVSYVSETDPDSPQLLRTYCKRMTVTVTSPYISREIVLSNSFAY